MSQAPVMPIMVDALLADTLHLKDHQFGAYCLLLFATWRRNAVPFRLEDDEAVRTVCRCPPDQWQETRGLLLGLFWVNDGFWFSPKLQSVWDDVQAKISKNRLNGRLGGRPKDANKPKQNPTVIPTDNPNHIPNETQTITIQNQNQILRDIPPSGVLGGVGHIDEVEDPDPKVDPKPSSDSKRRQLGTRIPDDWSPPAEIWEWARLRGWSEKDYIEAQADFMDYWKGRSRDAVKLDWNLTFRSKLRWLEKTPGWRKPVPVHVGEGIPPEDFKEWPTSRWRGFAGLMRDMGKKWPYSVPAPGQKGCPMPTSVQVEFGFLVMEDA